MFWYISCIWYCSVLFFGVCVCVWVKVLSLFETVAYNHKTDILLYSYITLLKVVSLHEGSSCITLQYLLILTKKKSESLGSPSWFPSTRIALLLTRLWLSVMTVRWLQRADCPCASISITWVKTNKNKVVAIFSLNSEPSHLEAHITQIEDSCHLFIFTKTIAIWPPTFDHEEITRRLLKIHFRHCLKESYLDCIAIWESLHKCIFS